MTADEAPIAKLLLEDIKAAGSIADRAEAVHSYVLFTNSTGR